MAAPATLPALLRRAVAAGAERVALEVRGGATLTYGSWDRRSDAQARGLQRAGVVRGDRVALAFDAQQWTEYAVAYIAVHKAAAVAVPLQPGLSAIELRRVVDHCRPAAVVGAGRDARALGLTTLDAAQLEDVAGEPPPIAGTDASTAAEILYASGRLSAPLSTTRSHATLLSGPSLAFGGDAGAGAALVHAFAIGTVAGQDALCACLRPAGVRVLVAPAFDPDDLCALLAGGSTIACALHPATARALVDSDAAAGHDLSGVSGLVLSGGAVSTELLMSLTAVFPAARMALIDVLGQSPARRTSFRHDRRRPGALGLPADGTEIWIADDAGRPLRRGDVGNVCAGRPGDGAPTGDRGYLDADGYAYVVKPGDGVVRRGSSSVSCVELESVLREHAAVLDAGVLDGPADRGADELAAAVVTSLPLPADELRAHVRAALGDEKTPERIVFVGELPRNRHGILLRRELRRRLLAPVAGGERGSPPSATQETVAGIYRRVLDVGDVGPDGDLFELGGDWTDAARLIALLEDAFGVRLALPAIVATATVDAVARAIERRQAAGPAPAHTPAAFAQEGMLWQECLAPGSQNLPGLARRYRGALDSAALRRALDEIIRRHEALRTNFAIHDGRLAQVVRPHRPLALAPVDLTALRPVQREAEVARLVADAGRRPFDLVQDPLFQPTLLRLDDDDHVLVIRAHHAIFDDWSVGVFRRELAALYTAYAAGGVSPLSEPPLQFVDFARSQRRRLAGAAGTRELTFWRRELAGAPLITQLAVDDPQRPEGSRQVAGEPVSLALPAQLRGALRALARSERTTLYMTMLAAFGVLVGRYSGQEDLLLATVVANRNATELEGLIGCFTKKVPLRLRLTGDPSFREALARTRSSLLGALSHQDLPFEAIVQDVLGGAAAAHGIVPQAALMFQGVTPRRELTLPGLQTEGFETADSATRAHFSAAGEGRPAGGGPALPWGSGLYLGTFVIVSVVETPQELSCVARGAFHAPTVRELMHSFRTLLSDIVADPARRVSELAILDERGQAEQLEGGRGPERSPHAATIPAALAEQVRRAPHQIAIDGGAEPVSYAQLDARSDRLAQRLRACGAARGARVGIALQASVEAIVAVTAVSKLGAAWVALDPTDSAERLAWIVGDAALQLAVADADAALPAGVTLLQADAGDSGGLEPASGRAGPDSDDEALIFYGARSKAPAGGVVLAHRCVVNLLTGLRAVHPRPGPATAARRFNLSAPWHDGFLRQLVAVLDGHCVRVPGAGEHTDPRELVALVATGMLDVVDCTPDELQRLLDAGLRQALAQRPPDAVEPVLVVGARAAVAPELREALRGLDRVCAHLLYGPPECAFGATILSTAGAARGAGRPLANVAAHVLDAAGRPVPTPAVGELALAGPSLARCQLSDSRATSEQFVQRTLAGARVRLHRTGQLARCLPDGGVELLGPLHARADLRGVRIDTTRIRSALLRCGAVRDADVAIEADARGERRLIADVVTGHPPPSLGRLRAVLWSRLPGYAWPSLVSGLELRGTAEQIALAALWAELMGVERVPLDENYWQAFAFLQAVDRARGAGMTVPSHAVAASRTLETLATALAVTPRRSSA